MGGKEPAQQDMGSFGKGSVSLAALILPMKTAPKGPDELSGKSMAELAWFPPCSSPTRALTPAAGTCFLRGCSDHRGSGCQHRETLRNAKRFSPVTAQQRAQGMTEGQAGQTGEQWHPGPLCPYSAFTTAAQTLWQLCPSACDKSILREHQLAPLLHSHHGTCPGSR